MICLMIWIVCMSLFCQVNYKKNMEIFKKLGFWEESAKAYRNISSHKEWTVLDLGCGNGVSTNYLKGETVVGVDLSEREMIKAKRKLEL